MNAREEARMNSTASLEISPVTTIAEVTAALTRIESLDAHGSAEDAHRSEDALHRGVLRAIADGKAVDGAAMAALALTTWDFQFSRWYS